MIKFTERQRKILDMLPKEYCYLQRSGNGILYVGKCEKAYEGKTKIFWDSLDAFGEFFDQILAGEKPVCFRQPILDDEENIESCTESFMPDLSSI